MKRLLALEPGANTGWIKNFITYVICDFTYKMDQICNVKGVTVVSQIITPIRDAKYGLFSVSFFSHYRTIIYQYQYISCIPNPHLQFPQLYGAFWLLSAHCFGFPAQTSMFWFRLATLITSSKLPVHSKFRIKLPKKQIFPSGVSVE